mgnify:FL=1
MNIGDRMKRYEESAHHVLVRRMPVMIRVDGKAFHTYTRGLQKPFDKDFITAMSFTARTVAAKLQGFKAAYIQSDEASFCITDYDDIDTQGWFDYDLAKVVSVSASMMTLYFKRYHAAAFGAGNAFFDSRAFNVPADDVVNCFLWRAKDWERNSIQMYAQSFFSHKQLQGKGRADMHEMLHGIGKNWTTDLNNTEQNGVFLIKGENGIITRDDVLPAYASVNEAIGHLFERKE